MNEEETAPPHQPNTPRVWWRKAAAVVERYPDWALAIFLIAFGIAVIL